MFKNVLLVRFSVLMETLASFSFIYFVSEFQGKKYFKQHKDYKTLSLVEFVLGY